jgi:hypothetical protein
MKFVKITTEQASWPTLGAMIHLIVDPTEYTDETAFVQVVEQVTGICTKVKAIEDKREGKSGYLVRVELDSGETYIPIGAHVMWTPAVQKQTGWLNCAVDCFPEPGSEIEFIHKTRIGIMLQMRGIVTTVNFADDKATVSFYDHTYPFNVLLWRYV